MRITLTSCAVAAILWTSTSLVHAQQSDDEGCPDGSWFCEDTPQAAPPQAVPPKAGQPSELPPPTPTPPPRAKRPRRAPVVVVPGARPAPPVIVYQQAPPPPAVVIVQQPIRYTPPPPPPPKTRHESSKWGVNAHLTLAPIDRGDAYDDDSGMGGMGLAIRYKPKPHVGLELGVDVVHGTDYQRNRRTEIPVMATIIGYVNPRSAAQFYLLAGVGLSFARVEDRDFWSDSAYNSEYNSAYNGTYDGTYNGTYDYFGGHLGLGLEFRLSRTVSLNFDLLGFVRGRIDSYADQHPEFINYDTGKATNTSCGALLRAGITFYW